MRASSSSSFNSPASGSRHARALNPAGRGAIHISETHNRLQSRSISWSDTNTANANALRSKKIKTTTPLLPPTSRSMGSSAPTTIATPSLSSSTSDSKIWAKRRKRGSMSAYGRIFTLVFFASLVLFLHALSGSGAPPPPLLDLELDLDSTASPARFGVHFSRVAQPEIPSSMMKKKKQNAFYKGDHDHLAVDPDGHYTYTSAFDSEDGNGNGNGNAYPWGWGRRAPYDDVDADDKGISDAGEEAEGVPEPTTADDSIHPPSFIPLGDAQNSPHTTTTPPPPPPVILPSSLGARGEEKKTAPRVEMEMELDLPLFELGDPPHALRVHLPTSMSLPEEHRRGSRARRARGAMLL